MDFRFDLDKILPDEFTCIDNTLIVPGWNSKTRNRLEYQQLYEIVNVIGEASSISQGLPKTITTSEKLQNSNHLLYLMKEHDLELGRSVLVGMLKIGRKKLFLLDSMKATKEVSPMCVLDFYIHESRQRMGYGLKMFNYMLKHQSVNASELAVDKPSDKFLSFLKRHYNLREIVPQINNFVVYSEFFKTKPDDKTDIGIGSRMSVVTTSDKSAHSSCNSRENGASGLHYAGKPSRIPGNSVPSHSNYMEVNAHNLYLDQYFTSEILYGNNEWNETVSKTYANHPLSSIEPRNGSPSILSRNSARASPSLRNEEASAYSKTASVLSPKKTGSISGCSTPSQMSGRASSGVGEKYQELITDVPSSEGFVQEHEYPASNGFSDVHDEVDNISGKVEELDLRAALSPRNHADAAIEPTDADDCASVTSESTGNWRDNISRNPEGLIEHMSNVKGTSCGGTLNDDDSVHGHLKFHHHALW